MDKVSIEQELNDNIVDRWLKEHGNDPVDRAALARMKTRIRAKIAAESLREPDAAALADNDAESSSVVELRSACCSAPTQTATTDYNVCTVCKEPCETTATTTKGDR